MATNRMLIFAPGEIYHVFNRGVERRPIFTDTREYQRGIELIRYYRFANVPKRYSVFKELPDEVRQSLWQKLLEEAQYDVIVLGYCLMPNHFHFLLRQITDHGISRFIANFSNGYTKYFNTRHKRCGPLLQGTFKAVRIDTDEQLIHLHRYIHLNPVVSFLVSLENLENYQWSSLSEYFQRRPDALCNTSFLDASFKDVGQYRTFIKDQVEYSRELEKIKHLMLDDESR